MIPFLGGSTPLLGEQHLFPLEVDAPVETWAGTGETGSEDGPREQATFSSFWCCCVAPNNGIYVGDFSNHVIRLVDEQGMVTTYAGNGSKAFAEGTRLQSSFDGPCGLCVLGTGELLVSDKNNHRIRLISQDSVTTYAGNGQNGAVDGPVASASFHCPVGICESPFGLLVADWYNHKIRAINNGMVTTFAGTGVQGCVNGPRLEALFNHPVGVCLNPLTGEIFVADRNNHRIRSIKAEGQVVTFAGSGEKGFGDGPGSNAAFSFPWSLCMTPHGGLIVADEYNHRLRHLSPHGYVSTLAGNGSNSFVDAERSKASFYYPACVSLSPQGDLYIADRDNHRLRRIHVEIWNTFTESSQQSLSLLGLLHDTDTLSDLSITLHGPSQHAWKLHSPVVTMRCPQLLDPQVQKNVQKLDVSIEAINAFVECLYANRLPPKLTPTLICELDAVVSTVGSTSLNQHTRLSLARALASPVKTEELLSLLGHVVTHCKALEPLMDLIIVPLRFKRTEVAMRLATMSSWLPPTDPLFLHIVGKIMGDHTLYSAKEEDSINKFFQLEKELATLFAKIVDPNASAPVSQQASSSSAPLTWRDTDFLIKLDNYELRCHKWVVSGRWSYLRHALAFGGAEAHSSILDLPSDGTFTPKLLESFVKYLYTNSVSQFDNEDVCLEVLKLARQYRLIDAAGKDEMGFSWLLDHCRSAILPVLNPKNCISIYKRILQFGTQEQQIIVRSYIVRSLTPILEKEELRLELEALGTIELVRLLSTMSYMLPHQTVNPH